jgi:hypothetical protein
VAAQLAASQEGLSSISKYLFMRISAHGGNNLSTFLNEKIPMNIGLLHGQLE